MARTPKITKADKQAELAAALKAPKSAAKKAPKVKATRVMFKAPDGAQLKMLFAEWRAGGVSLWDLKRKHHVKAAHMLAPFRKMATKEEAKLLARGPAAKVSVGKLPAQQKRKAA